MFILLVYRPEVDDEGDPSPFAGIELHGLAMDRRTVEDIIERDAQEHPEWHFCIMPSTVSN